MDKFDLKIYIGESIVQSDLDYDSKQILLSWAQSENDIHQLMSFALDGEVVSLDEEAKLIVEDRFTIQKIESLMEIEPVTMGTAVVGGTGYLLNRNRKRNLLRKKCHAKKFKSPEMLRRCLAQARKSQPE